MLQCRYPIPLICAFNEPWPEMTLGTMVMLPSMSEYKTLLPADNPESDPAPLIVAVPVPVPEDEAERETVFLSNAVAVPVPEDVLTKAPDAVNNAVPELLPNDEDVSCPRP